MQTGRQIGGFWKSSDTEYWSTELEYNRKKINMTIIGGFPGCTEVKTSSCECRKHRRHGFNPKVGKILWRGKWQPTPVFLPGKVHIQRALVGFSPWGCKMSHTAEATNSCLLKETPKYGPLPSISC